MVQDEKIEVEKASTTVSANSAKKKGGRPKGSKNKSKRAPKLKAGPGLRYDAKAKARILAAAAGKSIAEAHVAAVGVGYRGTAASLYQMLRNAGKKKGKRGRPKGSKNTPPEIAPRRPGRPAKNSALGGSLGAIDSIVSREVQSRINAAAKAAIKELQKLIK
jgi:hypothetical protein